LYVYRYVFDKIKIEVFQEWVREGVFFQKIPFPHIIMCPYPSPF
jgi:hypothetical protein